MHNKKIFSFILTVLLIVFFSFQTVCYSSEKINYHGHSPRYAQAPPWSEFVSADSSTDIARGLRGLKININTANAEELQKISGVGPAISSRIIEYRTQNGPFKTIEDIKKVKGIGPATFSKIKDDIEVDNSEIKLTDHIFLLRKKIGEIKELIRQSDQILNNMEMITEEIKLKPYELKVKTDTVEKVLEADQDGWAQGRIFHPHIAVVNGKLRMFFSVRENNTREDAAGFINLNEYGLAETKDKYKLRGQKGYKEVRIAYFDKAAANSSVDEFGELYAFNYYTVSAGEWAWFIEKYKVVRAYDDSCFHIVFPETVLTGNDQRGHWMGRDVFMPKLVEFNGKKRMFFTAHIWPWPADGRYTLAYTDEINGKWDKPKQISYPDTEKGVWPILFSGYKPFMFNENEYLFFLSVYKGNENYKSHIRAVYYKDGRIVWEKNLIDVDKLRESFQKTDLNFSNLTIHDGIDIIRLKDKVYIYFSVSLGENEQKIFKVEMECPEIIKEKLPDLLLQERRSPRGWQPRKGSIK